jgi:hypothetical protein
MKELGPMRPSTVKPGSSLTSPMVDNKGAVTDIDVQVYKRALQLGSDLVHPSQLILQLWTVLRNLPSTL